MAPSNKAVDAALAAVEEAVKPEWQWVDIPTRDLLDQQFHGVDINLLHYGSVYGPYRKCDCLSFPECTTTGRHKLPLEVASEVNERLRVARKQEIGLFSAKVNLKALAQVVGSNPTYASSAGDFLAQENQR